MKISILDQTHLLDGMSAEEGFCQTVELAQFADKVGLERFWLSEHHSSAAIVGAAPEILASYLLAGTKQIQIGTGGVMLTHYAPYKVAEQFKVMAALAPGRIALGVGRAPGGAHLSTIALQGGRTLEHGWKRDTQGFPRQIDELLEYMQNELPESHPFSGHLQVSPAVRKKPEVWVLGTSPSSAHIAAEKGLPFAFAQFINHQPGAIAEALHVYMEHFKPSVHLAKPQTIAAMRAIVAETDEEAGYLARSALHLNFWQHRGRQGRIVHPEQALHDVRTEKEKQEVDDIKAAYLLGSKETVARQIEELKQSAPVDELMAVSPIYDMEKRKQSYLLLQEAARRAE